MRAFALIALVPFALGQHYMVNLDCSQYPGPCNNDCYAAYIANKPMTLNYNGPGEADGQRRAAGCVSPSPCRSGKMKLPSTNENTCDEYPFASTVEGGSGSLIRCTDGDENSKEGTDVGKVTVSECGSEPCTFEVTFGNTYAGGMPFCTGAATTNDGFEYTYAPRGKYTVHSRDTNGTDTEEHEWGLHEPDEADYFHAHLRREFLLEDGSRTMLASRNQTISHEDTVFLSVKNGEVVRQKAIKELRGSEKSPHLQHPSLRAGRGLGFSS